MLATTEIGGRRFPVATVICPESDGTEDAYDEFDRSLPSGDGVSDYIPAENGLLFEVVPRDNGTYDLWLLARTCTRSHAGGEWIWLPQDVSLIDGELVATPPNEARRGQHFWTGADGDWVAETIYRLSHKPFVQPEGPEVRVVAADHFRGAAET